MCVFMCVCDVRLCMHTRGGVDLVTVEVRVV